MNNPSSHQSRRRYYSPKEVRIEIIDGKRCAFLKTTGEELEIGPPEKMSKSKKNTVDFEYFIGGRPWR